MKKVIVVLSVLVVVALGGLAATLAVFLPRMQSPNITQAAVSQTSTEAELAAEIAELQSQLQGILSGGAGNEIAGIAIAISSRQAGDIAIAFVGYGTIEDTVLVAENGVPMFEVDIRYGYGRYMVSVNAENGDITRMSRHDDAGTGIPLTDVVPNYPAHQPEIEHNPAVPNYPPHLPLQPAVPAAPTEQQSAPVGSGTQVQSGAVPGGSATPGSGASPSPGGGASPSPGSWSSPSPGGWSSPSPANPRWTGTGGREWTWGT